MVSDGQTVHFWPHSVIHNQKAVHLTSLKLWWEVNFRPPLQRQNFRDAYGLNCYPHPISCHILFLLLLLLLSVKKKIWMALALAISRKELSEICMAKWLAQRRLLVIDIDSIISPSVMNSSDKLWFEATAVYLKSWQSWQLYVDKSLP